MKKYSNAQEKKVAKALGGKKVPNSGATAFNKGDVALKDWLIECKTSATPKKSFSVKKEWLEQIKKEAFSSNKDNSALAFNFGDNKNYYIVSEEIFKDKILNKKG